MLSGLTAVSLVKTMRGKSWLAERRFSRSMVACDGSGTCLICFDFIDGLVVVSRRIHNKASLYPVPLVYAKH